MKITITGKHIELGAALQTHADEKITAVVNKYLDRVTHVDILFTKVGVFFECDIVIALGTGLREPVKGVAQNDDIYAAFESAVEKIEKQLRRYKRRLKNHHRPDLAEIGGFDVKQYVLQPKDEAEEVEEEHIPVIIAERQYVIEEVTVSDAVMRMDLGDLPALVFINAASGRLNVIYRRPDGNITWIDPVKTPQIA